MNNNEGYRRYACTVCGMETSGNERWFLMVDNRWQDKVKILEWNDCLAAQPGIHHVCCVEHVQELVVHWMATGDLRQPFAISEEDFRYARKARECQLADYPAEINTNGARQIGELSVHRESMLRVLSESPQSLTAILDALLAALYRDRDVAEPAVEAASEELWGALHEV